MKKLMILILFMTGINCWSQSQEPQQPDKIFYYKDTFGKTRFSIPIDSMAIIDMWARRGIAHQENIKYTENLMEQIRQAKIFTDSLAIALQIGLVDAKNQVSNLTTDNYKLQRSFEYCEKERVDLQIENSELKDQNKKLKRDIFWDKVTDVLIGIAAGTVAYLIITN